ncbi:MAG: hypothetical protein HY986_02410 [Candidatus Melainabacteria bacterium]|nr:hypothetical protein [Candidatus Melainabacteria bacterium]
MSGISYKRTYDCVVGGDDIWTFEGTGRSIRHWRGGFLVYQNEKCLGGIELVYNMTPLQFFQANQIPYASSMAEHYLNRMAA